MLGYLRSGNKRTKTIWWALTVLTVLSFVGGFIFLAGVGRDPAMRAQLSGAVGSVNGQNITRTQWDASLAEQRLLYRQQYGVDPQDRDVKEVEKKAWRAVVNEALFASEAKRAGLSVTDNEVLLGMRTNPPTALIADPGFQTDGKFDPSKYQAALMNPRNNWSIYEDMVRQSLPVRKLQEQLIASIKRTGPELKSALADRMESVNATFVLVPAADSGQAGGDEGALRKVYDEYKSRMAAPARTQLEVLRVPKQFTPDESKAALDMARSLYDRVQRGEDFAQLAKDYSEGPNAEKGGIIDRWLSPQELGQVIGAAVQVKKPGEVIEPVQEGSRVLLIKLMDPAQDTSANKTPPYPGAVKLSQIVVKVRPSSERLREQLKEVQGIASRARAVGLSKAATEKNLATMKTGFYDANNDPPQLFSTPEAADWGLTAKKGDVSPVFVGADEFVVAQVAMQHQSGPPTREEVGEQLKMIADAEHRVDKAKPRADSVVAAIKAGQSLEAAAAAVRVTPTPLRSTRQQPDPRLGSAPEMLGMLFAVTPGKIVGPVRTAQGWAFARLDGITAVPDSLLANPQMKGQLTNEILQRRQRASLEGFLDKLRSRAKVGDARPNLDVN